MSRLETYYEVVHYNDKLLRDPCKGHAIECVLDNKNFVFFCRKKEGKWNITEGRTGLCAFSSTSLAGCRVLLMNLEGRDKDWQSNAASRILSRPSASSYPIYEEN